MKSVKRGLGLAGTAVLSVSLLFGCTGGKNSPAETASPSKGGEAQTAKKVISVTFRDDGIGENGAFYKWLKETAASYPDKNVEIKPAPIQASEGDYFAKIAWL